MKLRLFFAPRFFPLPGWRHLHSMRMSSMQTFGPAGVRSTSEDGGSRVRRTKAGPGRAVLQMRRTGIMVGMDMGNGLTREAIYDLRRVLIGRLQMATRGIPKSRRIEELQAFAREWQKLWATGELGQLALLVDQKESAVVLPEIFLSLARMTEAAPSGSETEALMNLSYPTATPAIQGASGKPNSWWVGTRQGDLFPAGLALNPSREVPCSA
jgi:hypothetical protein